MKFLLSVISIALLSAAAEYFLPWWTIAVVSFSVSLLAAQKPSRAFLMGFCGIALFWLTAALLHDISNEHILSTRMAMLFKLPSYPMFICVTVIVGGLLGGLSAWSGALFRRKKSTTFTAVPSLEATKGE